MNNDGHNPLVVFEIPQVLYREPGDSYGVDTIATDGGMGVWVRSSTQNSPTVVNMSGSFRHGVVVFNCSLSQHLDSGARTFKVATNGGCTVLAMVMFTGTSKSKEHVLDFANGPNIDSIFLS